MAQYPKDNRLARLKEIKVNGLTNRFKMHNADYLYNVPSLPWLVEGIIPLGATVAATAKSGVGKSWFALEMMRAIATGTKFLGKFKAELGHVLYIGLDSSEADFGRQWTRLTLKEWAQLNPHDEHDADKSNPLSANVHISAHPSFFFDDDDACLRLLDLDDRIQAAKVAEAEHAWNMDSANMKLVNPLVADDDGKTEVPDGYIPQYALEPFDSSGIRGASLIVIDTYSKAVKGSQIDAQALEVVFRNIGYIRDMTGATILILHHNAAESEFNDGEGFRGGTAALGSLDCHIQLNAKRGTKGKNGNPGTPGDPFLISVLFKKFRGITPAPFHYRMNVKDETAASLVALEPAAAPSTSPDTCRDLILNLVETGNTVSTKMVVDMWASIDEKKPDDVRNLVRRTLKEMEVEKLIKHPAHGKWCKFDLPVDNIVDDDSEDGEEAPAPSLVETARLAGTRQGKQK